ncbi:MAG: preprotein translocase subunit SecA [Deltaproteobacteria bacterium]|nr:preprotein translocase subunit SecA [Deltaproteobacteria bacterium]
MIGGILKKVVGSKNDRTLKKMQPLVNSINALEDKMKALSDEELKALTPAFKERVEKGESLDSLLPEAFAAIREASVRVLGMRHFDVQLVGGIVLHGGSIAEMKTGEGKTLMATLPVYLNGLSGKGVHVVTVNDYLARRDAQWMGKLYTFMGLNVGNILHGMDDEGRKRSYACDITYGTNNEYGFDYLRDNMKFEIEDYVQRDLNFAIVDEVDSILIDEARTPLIISGPTEQSTDKYYHIDKVIPGLRKDEHYSIDEKAKSSVLTEEGINKVEKALGMENLYHPQNIETLHHVSQALKAHTLFKRDVDYVVRDNEVMIVDEFTGRLMPGRRYSDGLHQALEAKEGVKIENENQTLASITFQNYFRMYNKLSGMTGTAETEVEEFSKIYSLDVVVVPTNKPMARKNLNDVIYKTEREKFNAVMEEIRELNEKGQPVLVGTISIEKSEHLSELLKKNGIKHNVLNAKNHAGEAMIVAQAGRKGSVTLSTNMAGRGTDIVLGGNPEFLAADQVSDKESEEYRQVFEKMTAQCQAEKEEVLAAGGLHILGTERHESRRIDNQLRGRSGRQGDPGSSRFFLSLEDDLLRIFGSERISMIMNKLGMEEGEPIEHGLISRAIENAQKKVEGHNFDIRKHLLEYDDVMNQQRSVIYGRRRELLKGEDIKDSITDIIVESVDETFNAYVDERTPSDEWDINALKESFKEQFRIIIDVPESLLVKDKIEELRQSILDQVKKAYERKEEEIGEPLMRHIEKVLMLQTIDTLWKEHLLAMDYLKEGIGLRGYGQKDPKQEYKREGYQMFMDMMGRVYYDVIQKLFAVQIAREEDASFLEEREEQKMFLGRGGGEPRERETVRREGDKVGRNDPCPCGSGKKYKKCCGR